jgi:type VI secretion system secreted protein Hcp
MAHQFYITIQGTKQGKFKGESVSHKSAELSAFDFQVQSPRDAATGQSSGKRQFGPVRIVKEAGSASPLIWQALCNNETLKTIKIDFVSPGSKGPESVHYTVKLTNATISADRTYQSPKPFTTIVFHYETIHTYGHAPHPSFVSQWGKPSAHDDWSSQT